MNCLSAAKVVLKRKVDGARFLLARMITKQEDFILFQSFEGATYSDNPRAVSEKLHKMYPEIKIVWAFKDPISKQGILPDYVGTVRLCETLEYYKMLASCRVWVNNFSFKHLPKRKTQTFIQTWHGDRAFKKILNDSGQRPKWNRVSESMDGYCDLAVCGSTYGERQYRSAFGFSGSILMTGTPRDDCLVHPNFDRIREIKAKMGISEHTKLLLFAPTFRRVNQNSKIKQKTSGINLSRVLDALEKKYGGEWKGILRAHPAVAGLAGEQLDSRITDASDYEDMADLLLTADVLITDYSSSAGDFALLNRLLILYQPDRKEYETNDRALYFKMEDSPYFVAETQQEIEDLIQYSSEDSIKHNCRQVLEFYGTNETGRASEKVAEYIKSRVLNHLGR